MYRITSNYFKYTQSSMINHARAKIIYLLLFAIIVSYIHGRCRDHIDFSFRFFNTYRNDFHPSICLNVFIQSGRIIRHTYSIFNRNKNSYKIAYNLNIFKSNKKKSTKLLLQTKRGHWMPFVGTHYVGFWFIENYSNEIVIFIVSLTS